MLGPELRGTCPVMTDRSLRSNSDRNSQILDPNSSIQTHAATAYGVPRGPGAPATSVAGATPLPIGTSHHADIRTSSMQLQSVALPHILLPHSACGLVALASLRVTFLFTDQTFAEQMRSFAEPMRICEWLSVAASHALLCTHLCSCASAAHFIIRPGAHVSTWGHSLVVQISTEPTRICAEQMRNCELFAAFARRALLLCTHLCSCASAAHFIIRPGAHVFAWGHSIVVQTSTAPSLQVNWLLLMASHVHLIQPSTNSGVPTPTPAAHHTTSAAHFIIRPGAHVFAWGHSLVVQISTEQTCSFAEPTRICEWLAVDASRALLCMRLDTSAGGAAAFERGGDSPSSNRNAQPSDALDLLLLVGRQCHASQPSTLLSTLYLYAQLHGAPPPHRVCMHLGSSASAAFERGGHFSIADLNAQPLHALDFLLLAERQRHASQASTILSTLHLHAQLHSAPSLYRTCMHLYRVSPDVPPDGHSTAQFYVLSVQPFSAPLPKRMILAAAELTPLAPAALDAANACMFGFFTRMLETPPSPVVAQLLFASLANVPRGAAHTNIHHRLQRTSSASSSPPPLSGSRSRHAYRHSRTLRLAGGGDVPSPPCL